MSQYINLPSLYVNGLNVLWTSNTRLTIAAGQCRDEINYFDITLPGATVLNALTTGLNGLDTGTLAASTMYYVFVVYDNSLMQPVGTILSLSSTTPALPYNYSNVRRVGVAVTDGSTHFLKFLTRTINSNFIYQQWDTPISVLSDGSSATFLAVSLAAAVSPLANRVFLTATYTPAAVSNTANIRPTGSSAAAGSCPVILKSNVASVSLNQSISILPALSSGNMSIDYIVTASDALSLSVVGFEDVL